MSITQLSFADKRQLAAAAAILESIAEFPDGAPADPIYAVLSEIFDINKFNRIVDNFIQRGLVRRDGFHLLYPTQQLLDLFKKAPK